MGTHVLDDVRTWHDAVARDGGSHESHLDGGDLRRCLPERGAGQLDVAGERTAFALERSRDEAWRDVERPSGRTDLDRLTETEALRVGEELLRPELKADVREEDVARDLQRLR